MKGDRKAFWGKLSELVQDDLASEDRPEYRARREKMLRHLLLQRFRGLWRCSLLSCRRCALDIECIDTGHLVA